MIIENKKITFQGKEIVFRSAIPEHAESLCKHRYITSKETYFMARYPEECTFDIERMKANLAEVENSEKDFMVTAFVENEIVGDLGVMQLRSELKYRHRAYMGISIQQNYCNIGIGSIMIEIAIKQAKENGFEQLELGVFEDNARAIHLYEKFGFKQYGVQPRAFKLKDGTYRDEIIMVKIL